MEKFIARHLTCNQVREEKEEDEKEEKDRERKEEERTKEEKDKGKIINIRGQ